MSTRHFSSFSSILEVCFILYSLTNTDTVRIHIDDMCICVTTHRFVLAYNAGKCHRQVLLEYFNKDTCELVGTEHCCDVCAVTTEEKDMQEEMQAVVHSVQSLSNEGKKKVSMADISFSKSYTYICIYIYIYM